ncbi:hypothetical protein MMC10_010455 [Thelotrema lepadinum]|nr:hypothetical protein [Thelotrema lepadinum]
MVPLDAIVLDIGCGTVKPTASMIVDSGSKVHGIDFSSGMISICREQVSKGFFEQADILDYQPSSRFDAETSFNGSSREATSFIGALLPDSLPDDTEQSTADDGTGARHVGNKFMGSTAPILLYTKSGWKELLGGAGSGIVKTSTASFEPPEESGCKPELHFYVIAKRT